MPRGMSPQDLMDARMTLLAIKGVGRRADTTWYIDQENNLKTRTTGTSVPPDPKAQADFDRIQADRNALTLRVASARTRQLAYLRELRGHANPPPLPANYSRRSTNVEDRRPTPHANLIRLLLRGPDMTGPFAGMDTEKLRSIKQDILP